MKGESMTTYRAEYRFPKNTHPVWYHMETRNTIQEARYDASHVDAPETRIVKTTVSVIEERVVEVSGSF
jgi:hypothetical protein